MFGGIIGHAAVTTFLTHSMRNNRVAHAYLFLGPRGVGKGTVARAFAEALLHADGGPTHPLEIHPDVTVVKRLIDEKSGEEKSTITIEQVRALRERLFLSSLLPSWKIAIVEDADSMTADAANALLKTLEEPRGKTVIMLLAHDARRIPATVRSRAQLVRFGLVKRELIEAGLVAAGAQKQAAARLAQIAAGRPGIAVRLLQDTKAFKEFGKAVAERGALLCEPVYARMHWIEKHLKGKKATALTEELGLWRDLLRDELLRALGINELTVFDNDSQQIQNSPQATSYLSTSEQSGSRARETFSSEAERQRTERSCKLQAIRRLMASEDALRHHVDPRLAFEHFLCL